MIDTNDNITSTSSLSEKTTTTTTTTATTGTSGSSGSNELSKEAEAYIETWQNKLKESLHFYLRP